MATCLNQIATFLFLFAVALTPSHLHVHARESKFFSKVTNHISQSSKISIPEADSPLGVTVAAPETSPAPALTAVPAAEESGYQSGSNGVPSAPEKNSTDGTSVDKFKGKVSAEEFIGETFNTGNDDASLNNFNYDDNVNARYAVGFSNGDVYPTGKHSYGNEYEPEGRTASSNTYIPKGDVYPTKSRQGMSDTRYLENGRYFYDPKGENSYGNAYEPDGRTASGNTYDLKGDVYPTKSQQGMSDTRYLENGRYFYDLKGENSYGNAYEPDGRTASGNTYNLKGDVYPTKSQQGMSNTRYLENGKYFYNPKGDVYPTKSQQDMSDTRYLENGKYFYNPKGKNSYGDAYEQEERTATGNAYNANENGSDTYEFDTMEEYYRKQGIADPQDQGVYVP